MRHAGPVGRVLKCLFNQNRAVVAALVPLLTLLTLLSAAAPAAAAEPPSCQDVRLSDIGWTDVTAMTALTAVLLEQRGYRPQITVLSVPVTYASMKRQDIDAFMGNWMPSMEADRKPYVDDGSVEVLGPNLTGAKYTLAVPAYTYEAGLRDFADIGKFAAALDHTLYGIEPGNDGNRLVLGMIRGNAYGLGDFKLLESSEQGMLAEVERATRAHRPIVFLGWAPHPMNLRFRHALPVRWRHGLRAQLRRRHHLHQHTGRLCAAVPQRRAVAAQSEVQPRS